MDGGRNNNQPLSLFAPFAVVYCDMRWCISILLLLFLPWPHAAAQSPTAVPDSITTRHSVPAFVVQSIDNGQWITQETLLGSVYLIDFWATWCPPCVEALPELERIHKEWRERGFEILSLSFDSDEQRIRRFREKRFTMPWLHGRVAEGFSDILAVTFKLENIPHYILVDRDGGIIAEGNDVHGERLRSLLEATLGRSHH